jgi:solute carrier family 66 (lysosomal lysine-arginine transporter), member 1
MAFSLSLPLPEHCSPVTPALTDLSTYFHICVPTPLAALSTLLGTLSIVSWLFAQLPQIYKNYQLQSTAGLSVFFLVEWCLGDATNLLGGLFTKQAGWQVVVASYYVFVDVCLVCQYFWYTYFKPRIEGTSLHSAGSSDRGDADSEIINSLSPINSNFATDGPSVSIEEDDLKSTSLPKPIDSPHFSEIKYAAGTPTSPAAIPFPDQRSTSIFSYPSPRTILQIATISSLATGTNAAPTSFPTHLPRIVHLVRMETTTEVAGTILSWCSTVLYLGSRLPQLYKNWTRQSTAGLSPLLFFAAFCGNFFYATSLLTNPNAWHNYHAYGGHGWAGSEGNKRWEWIARAAPFFLGAAGVLALDAAMGVQFLLYGERNEEKLVKVRDGYGHSRWRRVSGWMRGWVPTIPGKERVVDLAESQKLLDESRELDRQFGHHSFHGEYGAV